MRRSTIGAFDFESHLTDIGASMPTLGFKSFRSATATLAGVELMHMIRKGQLRATSKLRPAQQFYSLAA
jgi:transposase-like protein